jgi:hypothetical protein
MSDLGVIFMASDKRIDGTSQQKKVADILTKIFVLFGIDLGVRFYAIWH